MIIFSTSTFYSQNVLKDHLKLSNFKTAWDPLYSLPISPNEIEYRHSLYVDIGRQYPVREIKLLTFINIIKILTKLHFNSLFKDGTLFHVMDVIRERVNNNQQLLYLSGAEKISVKWTTYCPKHNETITNPNTFSQVFEIFWPPSWITPIFHPISDKLLCIQDDNKAELLTRQCLPEFSQGASLTPLNVQVNLSFT